mmetsp:Transcript_26731/g.44162  ORF Transcript_26731/g.44162 Transcript_26731/m.44162 type:complete len:322 (-) Transcript_26731:339-1304(-)
MLALNNKRMVHGSKQPLGRQIRQRKGVPAEGVVEGVEVVVPPADAPLLERPGRRAAHLDVVLGVGLPAPAAAWGGAGGPRAARGGGLRVRVRREVAGDPEELQRARLGHLQPARRRRRPVLLLHLPAAQLRELGGRHGRRRRGHVGALVVPIQHPRRQGLVAVFDDRRGGVRGRPLRHDRVAGQVAPDSTLDGYGALQTQQLLLLGGLEPLAARLALLARPGRLARGVAPVQLLEASGTIFSLLVLFLNARQQVADAAAGGGVHRGREGLAGHLAPLVARARVRAVLHQQAHALRVAEPGSKGKWGAPVAVLAILKRSHKE